MLYVRFANLTIPTLPVDVKNAYAIIYKMGTGPALWCWTP